MGNFYGYDPMEVSRQKIAIAEGTKDRMVQLASKLGQDISGIASGAKEIATDNEHKRVLQQQAESGRNTYVKILGLLKEYGGPEVEQQFWDKGIDPENIAGSVARAPSVKDDPESARIYAQNMGDLINDAYAKLSQNSNVPIEALDRAVGMGDMRWGAAARDRTRGIVGERKAGQFVDEKTSPTVQTVAGPPAPGQGAPTREVPAEVQNPMQLRTAMGEAGYGQYADKYAKTMESQMKTQAGLDRTQAINDRMAKLEEGRMLRATMRNKVDLWKAKLAEEELKLDQKYYELRKGSDTVRELDTIRDMREDARLALETVKRQAELGVFTTDDNLITELDKAYRALDTVYKAALKGVQNDKIPNADKKNAANGGGGGGAGGGAAANPAPVQQPAPAAPAAPAPQPQPSPSPAGGGVVRLPQSGTDATGTNMLNTLDDTNRSLSAIPNPSGASGKTMANPVDATDPATADQIIASVRSKLAPGEKAFVKTPDGEIRTIIGAAR